MTARHVVFTDLEADPPVYPWGMAPPHLATRGQLAEIGQRPGRQGVQALILWPSRRGGRPRLGALRFAYLYDRRRARPRVAISEARAAALAAALAARQTCPQCGQRRPYVISVRHGACNPCVDSLAA
jgi:hypothetical protein